jgi:hypothetical protein
MPNLLRIPLPHRHSDFVIRHSSPRMHPALSISPRRLLLFYVMAALVISPARCLAWGAGHEDVQRAIFARLPAALRDPLDEATRRQVIEKDSHYPDSFEPFEPARIGEDAMKRLARLGIRKRYDLHSDKGRGIAFLELTQALREGRMDRANFWIACLAHSTADMSACNHDPLGHVATYAWAEKEWALKTASGKPVAQMLPTLDLHWAATQPDGARRFAGRIEQMRLHDDGRDLRHAVCDVMLSGEEGSAFLAPRGVKIVQAAAALLENERDDAARNALFDGMADIGAWCVARTLRDVDVAIRLAASDVPLEFDEEIQRLYEAAVDEHLRTRKLDDAIYASLRDRQAPPGKPAVAVVVEPDWRMNEAFLGFAERVWGAAIMHTLQREKLPFRMLDIRTLLTAGFPSPKDAPVVVLAAHQVTGMRWMKAADLGRRAQSYLAAGGRMLWIGGAPPKDALPEISAAMQIPPASDGKWPQPLAEFLRDRVEWFGATPCSTTFVRSPATKAGWQVPTCPYVLSASAGLKPLLQLHLPDGQSFNVGAAWPAANPQAIFLPTYALFPFLLSPDDTVRSVAEPELDATGRRLLLDSLALLKFE